MNYVRDLLRSQRERLAAHRVSVQEYRDHALASVAGYDRDLVEIDLQLADLDDALAQRFVPSK